MIVKLQPCPAPPSRQFPCRAMRWGRLGLYPVLNTEGSAHIDLTIPVPIECSYLDGSSDQILYEVTQYQAENVIQADCSWSHAGHTFAVSDRWCQLAANRVRLERRL